MKNISCALLFLHNQRKISPQPYYTENLGIQYIGAMLREAQYDVTILNADYEELILDSVVSLLSTKNYDFLGMAPCYTNMVDALAIAHKMKLKFPKIAICLEV